MVQSRRRPSNAFKLGGGVVGNREDNSGHILLGPPSVKLSLNGDRDPGVQKRRDRTCVRPGPSVCRAVALGEAG